MPGMYDKLGDLLSETLEAGRVKFVRVEKRPEQEEELSEEARRFFTKDGETSESSLRASKATEENARNADAERKRKREERHRKSYETFGKYADTEKSTGTVYKSYEYRRITPEVERAFKLLGVTQDSGAEQVKDAYRAKLKRFHPDYNSASETLRAVAGQKTDEVVKAYHLIMDFLK